MTMPRVEVITSVERRRRWSREEKERLVAASLEAGVTASEVARSASIYVSQLFRWGKEICKRADAGVPRLVPVEIVPAAAGSLREAETPRLATTPAPRGRMRGIIEIELGGGRRIRVDRDVETEALRRVLDALVSR
jgi:transposase